MIGVTKPTTCIMGNGMTIKLRYRAAIVCCVTTFFLTTCVLTTCALTTCALADPFAIPTYVPSRPSLDADELAALAPPSNVGTEMGTYGDAVFARRRDVVSTYKAGAKVLALARRPKHGLIGACLRIESACYRHYYTLTPTYVSAPQVFEREPGTPSRLIPPFVGLFLSAAHQLYDRP